MKKKIKILHLCHDEKFMDGAIFLFEKAFPGFNTFMVILPVTNLPLKYITNSDVPLKKIICSKKYISKIKRTEQNYDLIVCHGINRFTASLIISSAIKEKYMWSLLGAELYGNKKLYSQSLLGEQTTIIANGLKEDVGIIDWVKKIYRKVRYPNLPQVDNVEKNVVEAVRKVGHFGSLIKEEFDYLNLNKFISSETKFQPLSYYPLEYFSNKTDFKSKLGYNILVGNSASFTNNHKEIFDELKKLDIGKRKIITPLSYGNIKYQKKISKVGSNLFGSQFVPLIKFMSLKDYNKSIESCGITIMNHYRQQGVGNVLQSIWQGRKVYLSEKNVLFAYLNRIGCIVFSIESDLSTGNPNALVLLSLQEIERNRAALKKEISEDVLVQKLRKGLSSIIG